MDNIKGLIFDFGGTLDTGGDHWSHVFREGWNKAGVAADDALFREAYVFAEQQLERDVHILPEHLLQDVLLIKITLQLQYLAGRGHFPPAEIDNATEIIKDYCLGVVRQNISEAIPVLEMLAKSYRMGVVSNYYGNLENVLKELDILKYFKVVADSTKEGKRKPDTSLFDVAIKKLGLKPEEVMVIGDSYENDMKPAAALGCKTFWLHGKEWQKPEISGFEPMAIEKIGEVLEFLVQ